MAASIKVVFRVIGQRGGDEFELSVGKELRREELVLPDHLPEALKLMFFQRASMQADHVIPGGKGTN